MKTRRIKSNSAVNLLSAATRLIPLGIGGLVHTVRARLRPRPDRDGSSAPAGVMIAMPLAGARVIVSLLTAALLATAFAAQADAVFTSLHSFGIYTNGENPQAALVQGSDGNFYGTTSGGGTNGGNGTVFKITTNGVLTVLHTFAGSAENDGAYPYASLVQGSDGDFYGTTEGGGTNGNGTVFKISPAGVYSSLYSFNYYSDGGYPYAGLVQGSDGNFYGTTEAGGTNRQGGVFKISAGGAFTPLYFFTASTNDGAYPYGGLVQGGDGNLYGTTYRGGTSDYGTVFRISPAGVFTNLYSFSYSSDGGYPRYMRLVQGSDRDFYGTTSSGGTSDYGTVFKITTNGVLTSLHSFSSYSDGRSPYAGLVQGSDGDFYGTTEYGGIYGGGTVFKISPAGVFTNLYSFSYSSDGASPFSALALGSDGDFYGTTYSGGTNRGNGTVFQISTNGVLTSLYSFTGVDDGANPFGVLVQLTDGDFYGTTESGGTNGNSGTVFKATTNGVLTSLHSFSYYSEGESPYAGLVQGTDGYLYGTTEYGGTNYRGSVFKISASGALTPLYSFTGTNDGANPYGGLVQGSDGDFYGTTYYGGTSNVGTVFKISPAGVFTSLYSFTGGNDGGHPGYVRLLQGGDGYFYGTTTSGGSTNNYGTVFKISASGAFTSLYSFTGGNDGANPQAGLALGNDGDLYGTTPSYGAHYNGTVFKISPAGVFTNFHSFSYYSDGAYPYGALELGSDGNFYGTTSGGGTNGGYGTVFKISPSGVFTNLYSFTGGSDGGSPYAGLVEGYDGKLYGTTYSGGIGGMGTVFSLSVGLKGNPIVQFTASSTNGTSPLTVHFKSPNVDIAGNPLVSWNWDFGDGAAGTGQYPSHTYTTVGTFKPTLIATNNQGVRVPGLGPQITTTPINLVLNGGFETGAFTGWTTGGNFQFCYVTMDSTYVHSGNYGAELGPSGSRGTISQTLTTISGQSYLISLWLNSPDGSTPNAFSVNWNGNIIYNQSDIPAIGWTNLQFTVTATGTSTVVRFSFRDDLSYLGLDDISVVPVSGAGGPIILTTDGSFGVRTNRFGFNIGGTSGLVVVVEASTNLANPVWIPVSTNTLTSGTSYFYDSNWTNYPQRFYRVQGP